MEYESTVVVESESMPGVQFRVRRMSFGRRLELLAKVKDLASRVEFLEAGNDPRERIEATLLVGEIDKLYLKWGLAEVDGLEIDGKPATPELLVEAGPENLCREALRAIKAQAGLSEEEQKN